MTRSKIGYRCDLSSKVNGGTTFEKDDEAYH